MPETKPTETTPAAKKSTTALKSTHKPATAKKDPISTPVTRSGLTSTPHDELNPGFIIDTNG